MTVLDSVVICIILPEMKKEEGREVEELSLAELAQRSGTPGRTIRFYISSGLLAGPFKAGRGAFYGREHLQRLAEIRAKQAEGLTLTEVRHQLAPGDRSPIETEEPIVLLSYQLAPDVSVQVRADASPWRIRQIRRVLRDAARLLVQPESEEEENEQRD